MQPKATREITRLLDLASEGDEPARSELIRRLYDELKKVARRQLATWPPGHTLQATDLLHEVYTGLFEGPGEGGWSGRRHFFRAAATAMRHLLVDHARRKSAEKRGGVRLRIPLEEVAPGIADPGGDELIELNDAVDQLTRVDAERGQIAELRLFGGFSCAEIADNLALPLRTVERRWEAAKAWMKDRLR